MAEAEQATAKSGRKEDQPGNTGSAIEKSGPSFTKTFTPGELEKLMQGSPAAALLKELHVQGLRVTHNQARGTSEIEISMEPESAGKIISGDAIKLKSDRHFRAVFSIKPGTNKEPVLVLDEIEGGHACLPDFMPMIGRKETDFLKVNRIELSSSGMANVSMMYMSPVNVESVDFRKAYPVILDLYKRLMSADGPTDQDQMISSARQVLCAKPLV